MSPTVLGALLLGLVFGASALLLIAALRGWNPMATRRGDPGTNVLWGSAARRRLPYAIGVGIVVAVLTRWPAAAAAAAGLIYLWPVMFGGGKEAAGQVAKIEALATWTETLRDSIAGASGLEDAINHSLRVAAPAIRPALNRLVDSTRRYRTPLPQALATFAGEFSDGSVDRVVGSLILASQLRGPGLRDNLSALAASSREEVKRAYLIEAGRKSIRRDAMMIVGIGGFVGGWLAIFSRSYVAPYSTPVGQLVLLFVLAFFAAGLMWIRNSAKIRPPKPFLANADELDRIIHRNGAARGAAR